MGPRICARVPNVLPLAPQLRQDRDIVLESVKLDGYDLGYLAYGMAAPDPFGEGPICPDIARSVEDCTYSTEETRKFTKGGVEMK